MARCASEAATTSADNSRQIIVQRVAHDIVAFGSVNDMLASRKFDISNGWGTLPHGLY